MANITQYYLSLNTEKKLEIKAVDTKRVKSSESQCLFNTEIKTMMIILNGFIIKDCFQLFHRYIRQKETECAI